MPGRSTDLHVIEAGLPAAVAGVRVEGPGLAAIVLRDTLTPRECRRQVEGLTLAGERVVYVETRIA